MTTPDPLVLDLDPTAYVASLGRAEQATNSFRGTVAGIPNVIAPMQGALNSITPGRASIAGFTALAAGAGQVENSLSTMRAQAKTTGADFSRLTEQTRALARDMPIGNGAARQLIGQLTQLGISAAGNEKQIGGLAKTFTRLGAATGEGPGQLAAGMIQLNRSMGTGDGVARMEKLSDSLTTVSAKSGASASGILQFSKMIAPMAQASGIGQTKVMGISAAFARLGEDGFGASTAINRMMTDLSRSVREGSPQMAAYAQIVGKTRTEFEELFKDNPAEALTQITEAIGKGGANAPRQLESLGLDGVRTQRYLQQLSQSGGLREAINTSTEAYGSGSTKEAADRAFGGMFDSFARLKTNTEQLAEALGRPLTAPLGAFADMLGAATTPARQVAESKIGQVGMTALMAAALPLLIGAKLLGPAVIAAGLGQAGTSGVAKSFLGSIAMGQAGGDSDKAKQTLAGRLGGREAISRFERGLPLGASERTDRQNQRIFFSGAGQSIGGFLGGGGGGGGAGLFRQGGNLAGMLAGTYMRMQAEQFRQVRTPTWDRTVSRMSGFGPQADAYRERNLALGAARDAGSITNQQYMRDMKGSFDTFRREVNEAGGSVRNFRQQLVGGTLAMGGQMAAAGAMGGARLGGAIIGGGASLAMRGGRALMSGLGGPVGLGLTGAMVAYQVSNMQKNREKDRLAENEGISSVTDEYRVAMGNATEATQTFAARMASSANSVAGDAKTMQEAIRLSSEDLAAAFKIKDQPVMEFAGSGRSGAEGAGALLRLQQNTFGMNPEEVARIGMDLSNQFGKGNAETALGYLDTKDRSGAQPTDFFSRSDITTAVAGVGDAAQTGIKAWFDDKWSTGLVQIGNSSPLNINSQTKDQRTANEQIADAVNARGAARAENFDVDWAAQENRKDMDAAIATAIKEGRDDQVNDLVSSFQQQNGLDQRKISMGDINRAGGYSAAQALIDPEFAEAQGYKIETQKVATGQVTTGIDPTTGQYVDTPVMEERRVAIAPKVVEQGRLRDNAIAAELAGNRLQDWFSSTPQKGNEGVNTAITNLVGKQGTPESPAMRARALEEVFGKVKDGSLSFDQLAAATSEATQGLTNAADASFGFVQALQAAAMQGMENQRSIYGGTQGQVTLGQLGAYQAAFDGGDPNTVEGEAARATSKQGIEGIRGSAEGQVDARLKQVQQTQIQMRRMEEDYQRQVDYQDADFFKQRDRAEADFGKTVFRTRRNFRLQQERAEVDYNVSVFRAERSFRIQRERGERDFGIQMVQSTADYNKSRLRITRDFNTQMRRAIEDSAKSMFDPYKRLQVQPVWDASTLVQNLEEQTNQVEKQLAGLAKLREAGVSQGAIDILGLTDTANGQQVVQLVSDIMSDPALAEALNSQAASRQTVAGALMGDPSNTQVKRQVEDLQKSLADMAEDFTTQTQRATEAYRRSQEDARADFAQGMEDQYADYTKQMNRAKEDLNTTLLDMGADQRTALDRANEDRATAMDRMAEAQKLAISRMQEDLVVMDQVFTGSLAQKSASLKAGIAGQILDFGTLTKNGLEDLFQIVDAVSTPKIIAVLENMTKRYASAIRTATETARDAATAARGTVPGQAGDGPGGGGATLARIQAMLGQYPGLRVTSTYRSPAQNAAVGGSPTSYHLNRGNPAVDIGGPTSQLDRLHADLRKIGGWRELLWRVKGHYDHVHVAHTGGRVSNSWPKSPGDRDDERTTRLQVGEVVLSNSDVREMVTAAQGRGVAASGGAHYVTYHSDTYSYDHSVNVDRVELHANSPAEMWDGLRQEQRRANLTRAAVRR